MSCVEKKLQISYLKCNIVKELEEKKLILGEKTHHTCIRLTAISAETYVATDLNCFIFFVIFTVQTIGAMNMSEKHFILKLQFLNVAVIRRQT